MTRLVTECGVCGSENLTSVLSLGTSPPTCVMPLVGAGSIVEERHPLGLLRCDDCTLVQLSVIVDAEEVFPPGYPYSSGNSRALHADFEDLATHARLCVRLTDSDLVVDIGANDGTLLSKFACRTVGVEPTMQAHKIDGPFYRAFFTEQLARQIRDEHGPAKVVTACNVLAHVDDVDDVMRGIHHLLADDGVLIAENHDLGAVVDGQWDTVYHEHLRFYSPHSFYALLERYGLAAHGFERLGWLSIPTHGGSFRAVASKGIGGDPPPSSRDYDFEGLAIEAIISRDEIRDACRDGVVGIGATARATTIINYCELDVPEIECVCEVAGSDKIGHYIPGTSIEVVDEAFLFETQPPRAMLFSWHMADVIVPKLRERGYRGEIIVPLPMVRSV